MKKYASAFLASLLALTVRPTLAQWDYNPEVDARRKAMAEKIASEVINELEWRARMDRFYRVQEAAKRKAAAEDARVWQEIADMKAANDARKAAEQQQIFESAIAAAQRPNSGGIMVRGDKVVVVPGAAFPAAMAQERGDPPAGFMWAFPSQPNDGRVVPIATPDVASSLSAAYKRTVAKYPFLDDRKDPRSIALDAYILECDRDPEYNTVMASGLWMEILADEFAAKQKWPSAKVTP